MATEEHYHHKRLSCGIEMAALPIPGRRTTTYEIRVMAGLANEPADKLGVARLVEQTISKGTQRRSGQALMDAFDAIGAQCASWTGRESIAVRCSCLPEFVEQALTLHVEMLREPTFPEDFCRIAIELARQELVALEDDPDELSRRLVGPHAYGALLGRHELGTVEALEGTDRGDIVAYWRSFFAAPRMQVAIAGAVDVGRFEAALERLFSGFGQEGEDGRQAFPLEFSPGLYHHEKELEQEYIVMCWPGVKITDDDYPIERLTIGILSNGMSSRLFTEIREKRGLVYGVGAWGEYPRGAGMVFMDASSKTERCDQTVTAMLREVERLGEDVAEEELERAKVGIIAKAQTHGDLTRARASELSADLFHYGRPVPLAEKHARILAVTVDDVRRYLAEHRRDRLCVLTLGPRRLDGSALGRVSV